MGILGVGFRFVGLSFCPFSGLVCEEVSSECLPVRRLSFTTYSDLFGVSVDVTLCLSVGGVVESNFFIIIISLFTTAPPPLRSSAVARSTLTVGTSRRFDLCLGGRGSSRCESRLGTPDVCP